MENQYNSDQNPTNLVTSPIRSSSRFFKFLIIALTATIICLGTIFYIKRSLVSTVTAKPVMARNDNQKEVLKTYTNDTYGLQFQYPLNFSINESIPAVDDAGYKPPQPYEVVIQVENKQGTGDVFIYKWDSFNAFQEPMEGSPFLGNGSKRYGSLEEYAADYKMSVVMTEGFKAYALSNDNGAWSHKVLIVRGPDGAIYDLEYAFEKEVEADINTIISSFRLIIDSFGQHSVTNAAFQFDDDIKIEYYAPYTDVKEMLLGKGYAVVMPKNHSAREFPEIGDCGSGIDAICHVEFERAGIKKHIDVAMSDQRAFANVVNKKHPNPYWIVIGNE